MRHTEKKKGKKQRRLKSSGKSSCSSSNDTRSENIFTTNELEMQVNELARITKEKLEEKE